MDLSVKAENRVLIFSLLGELDSHSFAGVKQLMDNSIYKYIYDKVMFDFSSLTFMDSTGIGMLLGRYKLLKKLKKPCYIYGVSAGVYKILEMSGIFSIIKLAKNMEDVV